MRGRGVFGCGGSFIKAWVSSFVPVGCVVVWVWVLWRVLNIYTTVTQEFVNICWFVDVFYMCLFYMCYMCAYFFE